MSSRHLSTTNPIAFLLRLIAFFFAFALLLIPCFEAGSGSEAREIHVARLMYEQGEFLLPLRNGIIPSKPLLFHWLSVLLAYVLGIFPVWLPRVVSVTAAALVFATVGQCMLLVISLREPNRYLKPMLLWVPMFILVTCYGFTRMALIARVDMLYTYFTILAFYCVLKACVLKERASGVPWLFWIAVSCAVLARGPLGVLIPLGSVLMMTFFFRSDRRLRSHLLKQFCFSLPGSCIFVSLALPWYSIAWYVQGDVFIQKVLWFENVTRFTGGELIPSRAWYYYLIQLFRTAHIWWVLFLSGLYQLYRKNTIFSESSRAIRVLYTSSMAWILFGLLFFSLSDGKRTSYLLHLYPLIALNLGALYALYSAEQRAVQRLFLEPFRKLLVYLFLGFAILSLFVLAGSEVVTPWIHESLSILYAPLRFNVFYFMCITSVLILLAYRGYRDREESLWKPIVLQYLFFTGTALMLVWITCGFMVKYHLKGNQRKAHQIQHYVQDGQSLFVVRHFRDESFDSLLMYYRQEAYTVKPTTLRKFPCTGGVVLAFKSWFQSWKKSVGVRKKITVLGSFSQLPEFPELRLDREVVLFRCRPGRMRKRQRIPIEFDDEWRFYGVGNYPPLWLQRRHVMVHRAGLT